MKFTFKYFVICLSVLLIFSACKKQVAGPKGESGLPGQNGNANQTVISSFLILSQAWQTNTIKKDWNTDYFTDLITDEVLLKSEINVYAQINGNWYALPYTIQDFHLQYSLVKGTLHLNYFKSHQVANQPASMNFRLVIVSPK